MQYPKTLSQSHLTPIYIELSVVANRVLIRSTILLSFKLALPEPSDSAAILHINTHQPILY